MMSEPIFSTPEEMFDQLEFCHYEAIGGYLEMNVAYGQLKQYVSKAVADLLQAREQIVALQEICEHYKTLWEPKDKEIAALTEKLKAAEEDADRLYLGLIDANVSLNNGKYDREFSLHEARVEVSQ
jgi:hypothetical protein